MPPSKPNFQGIEDARKSITQTYLAILVIAIFLIMSIKAFNQQVLTVDAYNSEIWKRGAAQYEILNRREIFLSPGEMKICQILQTIIFRLNRRWDNDYDLIISQMDAFPASYLDATISFSDEGKCSVDIDSSFNGQETTITWVHLDAWQTKIISTSRFLYGIVKDVNLPTSEKENFIRIALQSVGLRPKYNDIELLLAAVSDANKIISNQETGDGLAFGFIVEGQVDIRGGGVSGGGIGSRLLTEPVFEPNDSENEKRMVLLQSLFLHATPGIPSHAELFDATNPYTFITPPSEDSVSIPFTTSTIEARFVLLLGGGILVLMYSAFLAKFLYIQRQVSIKRLDDFYPTLPILDAHINPVVGILSPKGISSSPLIWNTFLVFPLLYFSLGILFRFNFVDVNYVSARDGLYMPVIHNFIDYSGSGVLIASDISNILCLGLSLVFVRQILMTSVDSSLDSRRLPFLLAICILPIVFLFTFPLLGLLDQSLEPGMTYSNFLVLFSDSRIYSFFACVAVWGFVVKFSSNSVRVYFTFVTWLVFFFASVIFKFQ